MIHRFTQSEHAINCFEIPIQKVSKKKGSVRQFIFSDFPDEWNAPIVNRTVHQVDSWLFSIGGTIEQKFFEYVNTFKDLTMEQ
jgi:hypothetical protein